MASIIQKKNGVPNLKCTATIVEKNWVLTAAHCVKNTFNLTNYFVVVGSSNITYTSEPYRKEFPIQREDIFQHPKYPQVISSLLKCDIFTSCHVLIAVLERRLLVCALLACCLSSKEKMSMLRNI